MKLTESEAFLRMINAKHKSYRKRILPNVWVGRGSIVAAGSIVKQSFPENVVISGNPAKVTSKVPHYMKRTEENHGL